MNLYRQLGLTFVIVVVSAQNLVSSESDVWKQTGPLGVSIVSEIVVNSKGVLFLGTNSGLFRSTDDANTWVSLSEGLRGGAPSIEKIVLNSRGDIFVTVAYEGGVWRSTDGGNSWKRLLGGTVRALANNADNDLFAGIQGVFGRNNSIYRSTDNGENWELINKGIPDRIVQAVAVNPDGHILAGTNEHGLFKSTDNGDSWTPIDFDLDVKKIDSIAINKRGHIYVITSQNGILRSFDNGENWAILIDNSIQISASKLYIDADENIYILTRIGLVRSMDDGKSWEHFSGNLPTDIVFALVVKPGGKLFAGTVGNGLFRSLDNGKTWTQQNSGISAVAVLTLAMNQQNHIFAGTFMGGMFRSTDKGNSWEQINSGLSGRFAMGAFTVKSITFNSKGEIFAATIGDIFYSNNNGDSWSQIAGFSRPNISTSMTEALAINSKDDIFAGTGEGVFRSTDNGQNWTKLRYDFSGKGVTVLAISSEDYLFAGTFRGGLHRSTDGGTTWQRLGDGIESVHRIAINPKGSIYVITSKGFLRSRDNGQQWEIVSREIPGNNHRALAISPNGDVLVYTQEGVFRSNQNGDGWVPFNTGLPDHSVTSFVFDSDGNAFAGMNCCVFYSLKPSPKTSLDISKTPDKIEVGFSAWMSGADYQKEFGNQKKKKFYPLKVEGRNYQGKKQFRAYFQPYAPSPFTVRSLHGWTHSSYQNENKKLTSRGFRQICLNSFTDEIGVIRYQATWIKDFVAPRVMRAPGETGTVTDRDGNTYQTIKIGNQWWMAENLKVTHYRNGDAIPNVTGTSEWLALTSGAYCNYNNDDANVATYGRLYNWYAVDDSRNIAPAGWHVPTSAEWRTLVDYLGGHAVAGGKMKESATSHWRSPNTGATNESGFSALPSGFRDSGDYGYMGYSTYIWDSENLSGSGAGARFLGSSVSVVGSYGRYKRLGLPVRCVRDYDNTPPTASFTVTPSSGNTQTNFQFDASGSTDNEDATSVLQVRWDWESDGSWDFPHTVPLVHLFLRTGFITKKTASHSYSNEGTKTVKLEVQDSGGFTNSTTNQISVTISVTNDTIETGTVTDRDGNTHQTIKIGNQWWMAENLKVTHYRNGDAIPNVTGTSEWLALTSGAYCNYNNDDANVATYGRLYNWYAVDDSRNIAPAGWHVPTDEEWKELEMHLGMSPDDSGQPRGTDEGGKLKRPVQPIGAPPTPALPTKADFPDCLVVAATTVVVTAIWVGAPIFGLLRGAVVAAAQLPGSWVTIFQESPAHPSLDTRGASACRYAVSGIDYLII